jgi:hypothetical protein
MSLIVVGAVATLFIIVTALGGSRIAKQYAIGIYSLSVALMLAVGIYYYTK